MVGIGQSQNYRCDSGCRPSGGLCERFVPGNGFDYEKGVNFSTLITREHAESVRSHIESGLFQGARLICGGTRFEDPSLSPGNFVPATILADVTAEMRVFREEIFGPVGCVTPFSTEEEALRLANATGYGLAGGVFSRDCARAHRVASGIRAGQVYINSYFSKGMMESPGTGWKESGIGVAGVHKYMHSRTVFVSLEDAPQPPI